MLKTVGTSGQISLGKKYAGQHFEIQFADNGAVTLLPVHMVQTKPAMTPRKPKFHIVKVDKFLHLTREELNE